MDNTCLLIPVYDHGDSIGPTLERLKPHGLRCLLVDDGSGAACAAVLDALAARERDWVTLIRRPENGGKGAALQDGLREARRLGFSHALQIDADGQHDTADIPRFLAESRGHPEALVLGDPLYDESVPKRRLYGRYLTHLWVWINTLSRSIPDSMCGFRIYPVATAVRLIDRVSLGRRMEFDTEIAVRLVWEGVPVRTLKTPVSYPLDGVSHFDVWRDNMLISKMHAKLFFGMLARLPGLLRRRWR
jgi:glycosyltransferase involved in cell wall biosynthesis